MLQYISPRIQVDGFCFAGATTLTVIPSAFTYVEIIFGARFMLCRIPFYIVDMAISYTLIREWSTSTLYKKKPPKGLTPIANYTKQHWGTVHQEL